jgi:hypothetical protein
MAALWKPIGGTPDRVVVPKGLMIQSSFAFEFGADLGFRESAEVVVAEGVVHDLHLTGGN